MTDDNKKLSPWQQYKKNIGDTRPWDLFKADVNWATEETATQRYEICKACPELIALTKQCKLCLCFMPAKTKLQEATCPIEKWTNVNV